VTPHLWVGFGGLAAAVIIMVVPRLWAAARVDRVNRQIAVKAAVPTTKKIVGRKVYDVPLEQVPEPDMASLQHIPTTYWLAKWIAGSVGAMGLIIILIGLIEKFMGG